VLVLDAQVADDGLPRTAKLTLEPWKKISGPGDVKFETKLGENFNNSSSHTTITAATRFSVPGDYGLELTASDGERTSTVRVKVTVQPKKG
jgi:hypothetical protein